MDNGQRRAFCCVDIDGYFQQMSSVHVPNIIHTCMHALIVKHEHVKIEFGCLKVTQIHYI